MKAQFHRALRKGSPYRPGRSPDWLKMKNADAPAVKREAAMAAFAKSWRNRAAP